MQFLVAIILIISISLSLYLLWYNSAKQKGKRGELRVSSLLSQLSDEYILLNDVVFRTDKGTTQIDHIVVSKFGVFAIETKNYHGEIYGDDNRQKWTQIIVTDVNYARKRWKTYTYVTKSHFYNPVKQSLGHCFRIKELLSSFTYLPVVPIVVFSNNVTLNLSTKYIVVYEDNLLQAIGEYKTTYLTDNDVQVVLNILEENNIRASVTEKQHVKNVRKAAKDSFALINSGICPKCGGHLIERKGKYGTFYGCSNYPKCRFTVQ